MPTAHSLAPLPSAPHCPVCGTLVDGWTAIPGDPTSGPRPGDIAICLYCVTIGVYTDALAFRRATVDEEREFMADPGVRKAFTVATLAGAATRKRQ
jgi:hypothetical protein